MSGLTGKQRAFVDEYFLCNFNGTEAAARAGYAGNRHALSVVAAENLVNPRVSAEIEARVAERTMSANEVLLRLTEHGRGSLADVVTFRTVRRATTINKPAAEVIDELRAQMAIEETFAERAGLADAELSDHEAKMVHLRRRILRLEIELERNPDATAEGVGPVIEEQLATVDLAHAAAADKLHLVKSYNAKDDKVELYSAQAALELLGRHHKMFTDKTEHSGIVATVPLTLEEWKAQAAARRAAAQATLSAFEDEPDA